MRKYGVDEYLEIRKLLPENRNVLVSGTLGNFYFTGGAIGEVSLGLEYNGESLNLVGVLDRLKNHHEHLRPHLIRGLDLLVNVEINPFDERVQSLDFLDMRILFPNVYENN